MGGEQAVGDGLRKHVGKAVGGQVGNQVFFEGFVQLCQVAFGAFQRQHGVGSATDAFGQLGQRQRQGFAVVDRLAVAQGEGTGPLFAPRCLVGSTCGVQRPAQFAFEGLRHIAQFQAGVRFVPTQHAQGGQVAQVRFVGEVG